MADPANNAAMSAQFREALHFGDKKLGMCSEPLEAYFAANGVRPDIRFNITALDRGYVGEWKIDDGKLYLTGIWGELNGAPGPGDLGDIPALTIEHIFPGSGGCVFAEWFTGTLRCEDGKRLRYLHFGYNSLYERDIFLEIERGVLVSERVRENEPPVIDEYCKLDIPAFLLKSDCPEPREYVIINEHLHTVMLPLNDEVLPDSVEAGEEVDTPKDPLYDQAVALVLKGKMASLTLLRRCLRIDYYHAVRLIKAMQKAGFVSTMPYWWRDGVNSTQGDEPTPDGVVPMLSEWSPDVNDEGDGQNDALYDQAVALVIKHQRASPAFLRFRLHIGWTRSIHLIKAMQKAGLVATSRQKT